MSEAHDRLFEALLSNARGSGFVSDEAEGKLHEVVELILGDPRNQEGEKLGYISTLIVEPSFSLVDTLEKGKLLLTDLDKALAAQEAAKKPTVTFCEDNNCESPTCHRCFPRVGCQDHEKCGHATITGTAYSDDEAKSLGRTVTCKLCEKQTPEATAHLHQSAYIGECCWDDRLKATE